jgi:hypothetical protein
MNIFQKVHICPVNYLNPANRDHHPCPKQKAAARDQLNSAKHGPILSCNAAGGLMPGHRVFRAVLEDANCQDLAVFGRRGLPVS